MGARASARRPRAEPEGWTRKKAEAELRERLVRVERKGFRRPKPLTFAEYADLWFSEGETRRRWKPRTLAQYRSIRKRLTDELGQMPLAAIRPRHIAAYVAAIGADYDASTVNRDISLLHAIFTTAVREELIESNPAARAERPKLPRFRPQILEPVEVARVARAFDDEQARAVFLTLVLTGIRRSELQALRWRDVELVENVMRIRDSKSEEGIRSIASASPIAVMTKAGHADLRTTKRYLHLAGVVFREEAERLEERLLGGRKFYPSEPISEDLGQPEPRNHAVSEDA
jgi:hypothetical protein